MDVKALGHAGLHGWREKAAERVARRAPVADDVARAALGFFFFAVSLRYVLKTLRDVARELRA